jgi:hypothetical protein
MTRYHTILTDKQTGDFPIPPSNAYATHDEAVQGIIDALSRLTNPIATGKYEHRILLDVGSINAMDVDELRLALRTDPLLRAVFELGRQHQAVTDTARARDYAQRNYPGLTDG